MFLNGFLERRYFKAMFVLPLNGSKYCLICTLKAVHVLGILDPSTSLLDSMQLCIPNPANTVHNDSIFTNTYDFRRGLNVKSCRESRCNPRQAMNTHGHLSGRPLLVAKKTSTNESLPTPGSTVLSGSGGKDLFLSFRQTPAPEMQLAQQRLLSSPLDSGPKLACISNRRADSKQQQSFSFVSPIVLLRCRTERMSRESSTSCSTGNSVDLVDWLLISPRQPFIPALHHLQLNASSVKCAKHSAEETDKSLGPLYLGCDGVMIQSRVVLSYCQTSRMEGENRGPIVSKNFPDNRY